jgi:hypothetical protein
MHEENELTPAQRELEEALAGLDPTSMSVNRDQMMFQLGRSTGVQLKRGWQIATVLMFGALLLTNAVEPVPTPTNPDGFVKKIEEPVKKPQVIVKETIDEVPSATPTVFTSFVNENASNPNSYMRLRDAVLNDGVGALPSAGESKTSDSASRGDLIRLLQGGEL